MAEIKKALIKLSEGETFTADADGAYVITQDHTHSDLIRYMVNDIGFEDVKFLLETLNGVN